jgi:DNA-binding MarR family transcriptional regulator
MRITYRTMRVLAAIGSQPGSSNRQVALAAGVEDQGQASKLLVRLQRLELIENAAGRRAGKGGANVWRLTAKGREIEREIAARARSRGA